MDISLSKSQKHDLHLRLVLAGVEFVYESAPTYYFRQREGPRISGRSYAEQGLMTHYDLIQRHRRLIEEKHGTPLSPAVKQALARGLWKHDRTILREGHEGVAKKYFQEADVLADGGNPVVGNAPYQILNRMGGPVVAESIVSSIKRLTGV